jgi:16S rRNA processing protein RimM
VGFIKKAHGIKGDLLVVFEKGVNDSIEDIDFLFFEINGLLVPYFIEEMTWRSDDSIIFKFKLIDTKEKAQLFGGYKIFVDKDELIFSDSDFDPHYIINFKLVDQKLGEIGEIIKVNDFGGNIVFTVNYQNNEIMIPFNDELLVSIDQEAESIIMNCPEGLLDLN